MRKFVPIHIIFSYLALFVVFTSLILNDTSLASTTPQVSAGSNHCLALKSDGTVGNKDNLPSRTPVQVENLNLGQTTASTPTPTVTASLTPTPSPTPNDSNEVLVFSDDFERSDYSDKWTSGVSDDCGEETNADTITIVNGYIQSTDNCNYIESIESFSGNLRIEVDVMKVGQNDMSCWDFFVELVSTGLTGTILFDYNGIDGININTSRDCGDKYTMNSSGVNKGKAVLTYARSRAWFSFTNDDGNILETNKILIGPFVASKIRIWLAARQDSPRYIDNVKIYSLGSATASTPTPKASPSPTASTPTPTSSPTPKATPTPTPAEGTGVIYGFVLDENEFAFKNVSVALTYANGYSKSAKTDSEGYYEFANLAAGDYTLTYSKDGYQTQTQEVSLEEDESLDIGTITMEPVEKGMISGYVVNIRGDPIEYVKLKLKGIKAKKTKTAVSDADGFFEFTGLDADDYIITAKRSRYKSTRKTIQLEEGDEVEIEVEMKKTSRRGVMVLDQ